MGKFLLLPFSFLFWIGISLRNWLYSKGILKSKSFTIFIVSVGNLSTGGTGKSPMILHLLGLLGKSRKLAVLSRGYGRKTKGFREVIENDSISNSGDEPVMVKNRFPEIPFFVCEKRAIGIENIAKILPETNTILLDDAFQHRAVQPNLNIVLIPHEDVFSTHWLLPAGYYRETFSALSRADVIVVSKCPEVFSPIEERRFLEKLKPLSHQKVFFSFIRYGELIPIIPTSSASLLSRDYYLSGKFSVLLVTGIAKPKPLLDWVSRYAKHVIHLSFADHHSYSTEDLEKIKKEFDGIQGSEKIILTTEKDAVRLNTEAHRTLLKLLNIRFVKMETGFHKPLAGPAFETFIQQTNQP